MSNRQIIDTPGQRHFVTFSTFQRRRFLESEATKNIVLEVLQKCLTSYHASCSGFVVMPNHVHALLFGGIDFRISPFIQVWKKTSSYRITRFFSQKLEHYLKLCPKGCPIWQAGFYDFNVESEGKLNEKIEYMHQNPVVAGLTTNALAWRWSSATYCEHGKSVGVTMTQEV